MNIKQLFDEEKRQTLLEMALKRIRAKKGGTFPFAFAMVGRGESLLVIDSRNESTADKMMKQARKSRPRKLIVGKLRLEGRCLHLEVEQKKGTIKAIDVKSFLASSGLAVRKAEISDTKAGSPPSPNASA